MRSFKENLWGEVEMGHSYTIHLVGIGTLDRAMNVLEKMQVEHLAEKHGMPKIEWYAQTRRGVNILNARPIKTIPCICPNSQGCHACNYSGITTQKNLNGYRDWQLEAFSAGDASKKII